MSRAAPRRRAEKPRRARRTRPGRTPERTPERESAAVAAPAPSRPADPTTLAPSASPAPTAPARPVTPPVTITSEGVTPTAAAETDGPTGPTQDGSRLDRWRARAVALGESRVPHVSWWLLLLAGVGLLVAGVVPVGPAWLGGAGSVAVATSYVWALAARTEAEGDEGMPPFEKTVTVTVAGQTDRLFSLRREAFDYSGGAHPNTLTTGIVWDRSLKRVIGAPELFRKGADLTALDQALCTAVNAARRARVPDARTITLAGRDGWACPRAAETPFVLAPGDQAGKAGGLIFLIGPYQVGPGAEGGYEIAIPQTAFKSMIATAYAGEFAG